MTTTARYLVAAVLVAALVPPTHAAPWKPKKQAARDLLNAAVDTAEAGDFERAATLALQSLTVEASIFAHWSAGQALMAGGAWARAIEQYDRALADAALPRKERKRIEDRRQLARAFLAAAAATDARRWDEARAAYLSILDRDNILPADRTNAGAALEHLAQRRAAAEAEAKPTPAEQPTAPTSAPTSAPTNSPTAPLDVRAPSRPSRWSDTSALALLGTGAIGVGAGFWLRSHAQDLDDQADDRTTAEPDRAPLRDRADRYRTGATVAFAAGGALVVVGLIKLAIPPDAPRPTLATLQPTTGGALVVVGGRF